ncbi:glycoside hydrolase family 3 protein [Paraglaciecola sp. MB-3u-78]|uniref:glycoside hydrolase family 3 protein n=1 Tax=Paraglaciecola sp. MB-3u-78 TaxID=2058332 RepID=UPI000C3224A2|nr:glycoside hydrolase family 3 protein [Paraglaciecola sp. MB-3u-78]PKG99271.1 endoglucanase [Paraglaciecola sp. MB-3u-78]
MIKKRKETALDNRVNTLLSIMTLEQKVGQMTQAERTTCSPEQAKQFHIGSILSSAGSCPGNNQLQDWVEMNDAYWRASTEKDDDHLGIPILYGLDAVHGNNNVKGATVFPHNIGLGAANDTQLIKKIAQVTAKEVLATGVDWTFAPNLAVARDYHWGRNYESFSEDPAKISNFATKIVQGLQGVLSEANVMACAKHFVGDGGTHHGIDHGDTRLSFEALHSLHIQPFEAAIKAGVLSVMVSFSSVNGDKCHGHKLLLVDTLKEKMGFEGILISDMQGIDYLEDDFYLAVAQGVNAGIDMFMVPRNWPFFIEHLLSHIELGTVPISRIDDAVRRILSVKCAFGLFEKPRPTLRKWSNHPSFGSDKHRQVARKAVRKSLVLLKNTNKILPLKKHTRILVAGKNAHNIGHQCGGFTITWQGVTGNEEIIGATSIWQGIKQVATNTQLSVNGDGLEATSDMHDVAIVVIGEKPYAEGIGDIRVDDKIITEAGSQINGQVKILPASGHSLELNKLYPEDLQTIKNITDKGVPVIAILVSGRPLIIEQELATSSAFIAAWLPGSEGQGISDVLFGDYDFTGKLSFSWPQLSQPKVNKGDKDYNPLFPYGFGLKHS